MAERPDPVQEAAERPVPFKLFLEGTPLLTTRNVSATLDHVGQYSRHILLPPIELYCPGKNCGGRRFLNPHSQSAPAFNVEDGQSTTQVFFAHYRCRNCHQDVKLFALHAHIQRVESKYVFRFMKVGEAPAFGEPRPNVITDVLDDEIAYFERGYRAEVAGLGIGAFAYYRRFVESHKDKLIDTLRAVAVAQAADENVLLALDRARKTNSFERAVDEIKDAIPPGMRLKGGHNPLTLLHSALSIGVHKDDDAECLARAQDIRTVLTALASKTTEALADSAELSAAVGRLSNRKTAKPAP
jgi:hypothetical protein